jgi:hypothetical protein
MQKFLQQSCLFICAAVLFAGCATPTENAAKQAETAPKHSRQSDQGYHAICDSQSGPVRHEGTWLGPIRSSKETAIKDCAEHNKTFPGHDATIVK